MGLPENFPPWSNSCGAFKMAMTSAIVRQSVGKGYI